MLAPRNLCISPDEEAVLLFMDGLPMTRGFGAKEHELIKPQAQFFFQSVFSGMPVLWVVMGLLQKVRECMYLKVTELEASDLNRGKRASVPRGHGSQPLR